MTHTPLWFRDRSLAVTAAVCLAVIGASILAAALVDDDDADTAFGVLTGMAGALLVAAVAAAVWVRRSRRAAHDRTVLDGLEPLREGDGR